MDFRKQEGARWKEKPALASRTCGEPHPVVRGPRDPPDEGCAREVGQGPGVGLISLDGMDKLGSLSSLGVVYLASGTRGDQLPYSHLETVPLKDLSNNLWEGLLP